MADSSHESLRVCCLERPEIAVSSERCWFSEQLVTIDPFFVDPNSLGTPMELVYLESEQVDGFAEAEPRRP